MCLGSTLPVICLKKNIFHVLERLSDGNAIWLMQLYIQRDITRNNRCWVLQRTASECCTMSVASRFEGVTNIDHCVFRETWAYSPAPLSLKVP